MTITLAKALAGRTARRAVAGTAPPYGVTLGWSCGAGDLGAYVSAGTPVPGR